MSSLVIAALVFACTFGGAMAGILLHVRLPEHHRNDNSKEVIKLVMGLVATVAALVLGLLISSAKTSYDAQKAEVQQLGIHLFQLDHILMRFGPDGRESREQLRRIVSTDIARTWPGPRGATAALAPIEAQKEAEELFGRVANLPAGTDAQRVDQSRALQQLVGMWETHRILDEQAGGSLSWPFLVVLVFWLTALFVGFGLFTRFNLTVCVALLVGALSVAGAVFLILEMNQPYRGIMQISSAPIRNALPPMVR
jgi:hypothetical protein